MKPKFLKLKGFTGISNRENGEINLDLTTIPEDAKLVALIGPNGAGKTTVLDNLHPYRVMPSRSTTMTPGGFSYWDNITGKEAQKELVWEHDSQTYRTILNFTTRGKTRKTECWLMIRYANSWIPVSVDGHISDGKSDTYDSCIEAILGKPERFFTAQFSAQNRKLISDYGASEIKCLLASILSLDVYKQHSERANEVARLLQAHVNAMKEQSQKAVLAMKEQQEAQQALDALTDELSCARDAEQKAVKATAEAVAAVSRLEAQLEQESSNEKQRQQIQKRIIDIKSSSMNEEVRVKGENSGQINRINDEIAGLRKELADLEVSDVEVKRQIAKDESLLSQEPEIRRAAAELPQVQDAIETLEKDLGMMKASLKSYEPVRQSLLETSQMLAEITQKGKAKAEKIVTLTKSAELLQKVPCRIEAGGLISRCPLVRQAHEAEQELPLVKKDRLELCSQYKDLKKKLESLKAENLKVQELENQIADTEEKMKALLKRESQLRIAASSVAVIDDAKERIDRSQQALQSSLIKVAGINSRIRDAESRILEIRNSLNSQVNAIRAKAESEVSEWTDQLSRLAVSVSAAQVSEARAKVRACQGEEGACRKVVSDITKKQVNLSATVEACTRIQEESRSVLDDIARLEGEIAQFRLIEKAFGVNGIIALSIDDAGPAIASICNQLLEDCFNGRFSVRLNTQKETQKGDIRETFDVIVFDNVKGGEKDLAMMSGGERVWVNECLTRAIALYVAQSSDTKFDTLFTDEADGALDPERKRQFIAMKRAIMSNGGYSREYFVSQTPELWEMADHVIDVSTL